RAPGGRGASAKCESSSAGSVFARQSATVPRAASTHDALLGAAAGDDGPRRRRGLAADADGRGGDPPCGASGRSRRPPRPARGELAQRRGAFDLGISAASYLERCELKTARLFECACLIGRTDAGADGALREFGHEIGLAFQLLDDVLDVTGPPERTGKARGTDLLDGTVTLPLILAREEDRSLAKIDLHQLDAEGAEAVCDRVAATGALERVRTDAR